MNAVANSTVLILLAKTNRFDLLKNKYRNVFITQIIKEEITRKDLIIKREINKFLKIKNPKQMLKLRLDKGEESAISLASEIKLNFLSDDKKARLAARTLKINVLGTVGILFWNLKRKNINKKEFIELLHALIKKGFYISAELYSNIVKTLDDY